MQVFENELVGFFLSSLGTRKMEVARRLGEHPTNYFREALAELLLEIEQSSPKLVQSATSSIDDRTSFKSVLFKHGGSGDSRKIIIFSFEDAFKESALPLIGVLVATFSGSPALTSVPGALMVMKTLWNKLIVLRLPQDRDAMDILEALGSVAASNLAEGRPLAPTWEQVVSTSGLNVENAIIALTNLRTRAIVDIESWGGQTEDVKNPANCLRVRL